MIDKATFGQHRRINDWPISTADVKLVALLIFVPSVPFELFWYGTRYAIAPDAAARSMHNYSFYLVWLLYLT